ncbi:MAG: hypothetical protein E6538_02805 [Paeniclostridium sordellii]|nr:hypothetical protein [Paeniclostridium sordellii]
MIKLLKLDLQRAIFNKQFSAAILIGVSLSILAIFKIFYNDYVYHGGASGYYSPFRIWFGNDISSFYPQIFFMIFPILSSIPFANSYWIDKNSGFSKNICTRCKKINYITSKYIINFIVGGIVVIIPFIVSIYIVFMILPAVKPSVFYTYDLAKSMFNNLYYSNPYIYIFAYLLIYFMYGGVYASIGLTVSIFSKNKFSSVAVPSLVYISMYILETLGLPQLVPSIFFNAMQPVIGININSIIAIFLILFFISLLLYIIGVHTDEII